MKIHQHTNALRTETSPYLQQHARNPVNWYPWGKEALDKARSEDKLIIVSIGYSSCHWCHVMERESFEDEEVAYLMNALFVSIKVDREERPDLDHVYMSAVQLLGFQGGWPLNCIALPDGRPIWGGTYFPKLKWMEALQQVNEYFRSHREDTITYASQLEHGIQQQSLVPYSEYGTIMDNEKMQRVVESWISFFDSQDGGQRGAPKFPMPGNLEFLLHYAVQSGDRLVLAHVETTLTRMARGGIYDQAGGGFARYAVDSQWKIPHFEKMLYDNAQLIGLYSSGFQIFGKDCYREVVQQTIEWVKREMLSSEGAFFTALDADSEGKEGAYYIWREEELADLIREDYHLFTEFYNIGEKSRWEGDSHILIRSAEPDDFAEQKNLDALTFRDQVERWNRLLLDERRKRIPPGLDDKSLTSWNSLMISGLVKAFHALGEREYLVLATECANLIQDRCWDGEGNLMRCYKEGIASIPGFHIDYSLYAEACLELYTATLERKWLDLAVKLTSVTFERFFDRASGFFNFNGIGSEKLITDHVELQDNVIPSSNSVMAHNLFRLGHLLGWPELLDTAMKMLKLVQESFGQYPSGYTNWGRLILKNIYPFFEVAVTGHDASELVEQILNDYQPNMVVAGTIHQSDLPLFRHRFDNDKSLIFVCRDHVCQLPFTDPVDAKNVYHIG